VVRSQVRVQRLAIRADAQRRRRDCPVRPGFPGVAAAGASGAVAGSAGRRTGAATGFGVTRARSGSTMRCAVLRAFLEPKRKARCVELRAGAGTTLTVRPPEGF
jgi:hypothetical protein